MTEPKEWLLLLQAQLNAHASIADIARKVGVHRSTLSAIINRTPSSPYVNGKSSTANIEKQVMTAFGKYICPHLTARNERDEFVTGEFCKKTALAPAPTLNPVETALWRACQECSRKPAPSVIKVPVPRGPKTKRMTEAKDEQMHFFERDGNVDEVKNLVAPVQAE